MTDPMNPFCEIDPAAELPAESPAPSYPPTFAQKMEAFAQRVMANPLKGAAVMVVMGLFVGVAMRWAIAGPNGENTLSLEDASTASSRTLVVAPQSPQEDSASAADNRADIREAGEE